ncbi:alpha/beta hydrolase [Sphingobacterium sp. lm-10]|uniref:alpha/beta hydrolase n=1 Tax=Sphingobacterium sp. lm-10 TaxID=2944904 RepID=UPI0020220F4D|nr:alpha/beta hydrolase [Sphingobacterium sp. lm-10]MCL7989161.1 alpha/beta hydrolase [Sphingobacterium sp. lm-10]
MTKHAFTFISAIFFLLSSNLLAQSNSLAKQNIPYYGKSTDDYKNQQCLLDVYIPEGETDFATIVWFHGGGLTGGQKEIPEYLKGKGMAVVGVGYRFSPQVKVEDIIQDAAQAVNWVFQEIESLGGSRDKIVLSGHSAGGYLGLMITLNKSYLQKYDIDADKLLGIVPFSPQAITHFTARQEQGIDINQPTIDAYAPLFWVRNAVPPTTLITGGRDLEMVGRYEENAYLKRMLEIVGNDHIKLLELDGYDHGMVYPALPILVKQVKYWLK